MGLLNSRLNARRFHVEGELPENFREIYRDNLQKSSFVEPPNVTAEAVIGWTDISNMLSSEFENFNTWYVGEWILFGMRIDKRSIPAAKLKAEINLRCAKWAQENGVERCPGSVRADIKETIQAEWLPRVMPKTVMHEVAWNVSTNRLYFSTHSDAAGDVLRKRFFMTFGRKIYPLGPLAWIDDEQIFNAVLSAPPTAIAIGGPRR